MFATVGLASGHATFADIMFVVALVLFLLAGLIFALKLPADHIGKACVAFGLAAVALGWLVL